MTNQNIKTVPCAGCRAPIFWRRTLAGALMPLDAATTSPAQGTYVLAGKDGCRPTEPLFDDADVEHHMNHWATCPRSKEFKR